MFHWLIGYIGLSIGLNPSTRLLWGETSWAMSSAVLLYIGIRSGLPWLSVLAAGVSLWAWMRSHKHYRQIADIPTAKLSAAPQGYIEVSGTGETHSDYPVVSPLTGLPCLWYEFTVWEIDGNKSRVINSGTSTLPFSLVDGNGHALVVPEAAQVISRHSKSWRSGDEKYHERVLLKNESLYVLGDHVSSLRDEKGNRYDKQRNALLNEWKNDQETLKKRFDADRDGHIDAAEWETARQAAESLALLGKAPSGPDEQYIRKPSDGRPFLISNYSAQQLAARFRRWSWLHLGIFIAALFVAIP
jgi:hypothetical protein